MEALAKRLEDECEFKIWLDKWTLVPGKSWQQGIAKGLNQAAACAAASVLRRQAAGFRGGSACVRPAKLTILTFALFLSCYLTEIRICSLHSFPLRTWAISVTEQVPDMLSMCSSKESKVNRQAGGRLKMMSRRGYRSPSTNKKSSNCANLLFIYMSK